MGTLTKKHYAQLAEIIRHERMLTETVKINGTNNMQRAALIAGARNDLLRSIETQLIDFCWDNSKGVFNASKFRDAAQLPEGYTGVLQN